MGYFCFLEEALFNIIEDHFSSFSQWQLNH